MIFCEKGAIMSYEERIINVFRLLNEAYEMMPANIKNKEDREDIEAHLLDMLDVVSPREY
jgi:hypothetical protein